MSENTDLVHVTSLAILKERFTFADSEAIRCKAYAVYGNSTPTPEDAHPAVKIVEAAVKANILAEAIFRTGEAARFKAAIIELEATK
jgi:hypothetical protein